MDEKTVGETAILHYSLSILLTLILLIPLIWLLNKGFINASHFKSDNYKSVVVAFIFLSLESTPAPYKTKFSHQVPTSDFRYKANQT
jgi:hypothetical protein